MSKSKAKEPRVTPPLTVDSNQRYNVGEAAAILRISRAYLYRLVAAGSVESFTEGRRRYFSGAELIRRAGAPS
jgi:excisionase family DNA binding protein